MEESKKAGMRRLTNTVSVLPLKCFSVRVITQNGPPCLGWEGIVLHKNMSARVQVLAVEDFVWLVALYWWYLYMLHSSLQSHFNAVYNWHGGIVLPYHCFVGGRL